MNPFALKTTYALALVIGGLLAVGPVMAASPFWPVASKHERDDNWEKGNKGGKGNREARRHFEDRHAVVVREYYTEQFRGGRCPPGLRKKNNGCMPPGQAKKWQVGRPLPRDVVYYEVPQPLVMQIGPPPAGHRYVRVGGDILMLATGTRMVVDAIQNLGRR